MDSPEAVNAVHAQGEFDWLRSQQLVGFIFISMEDETGIANVIVTPDLYEGDRVVG